MSEVCDTPIHSIEILGPNAFLSLKHLQHTTRVEIFEPMSICSVYYHVIYRSLNSPIGSETFLFMSQPLSCFCSFSCSVRLCPEQDVGVEENIVQSESAQHRAAQVISVVPGNDHIGSLSDNVCE